jgi:hypothetical protein
MQNEGRSKLQSINKILLLWWDPLLIGSESSAADEYEVYGGQIYALILASCTEENLTDFLLRIEVDEFGLAPNSQRAVQVAKKLCALTDA